MSQNENLPKYKIVEQYIKKHIKDKMLEAGSLLPTETKIAQELDVHQNTVKKGLQELVNKGIIQRERGKGTFVRNPISNLRKKHQTVGIIVEDLFQDSPLCAGIVKGAEDVISNYDLSCMIGNSNNDYDKINDYLDKFFKRDVAGVILMPLQLNFKHQLNYYIIDRIKNKDIPLVFVDRYLKGVSVDYVTTDNEKGGYQVTKHLLELGHEKIACIFEPYCSTLEERHIGYKLALAEAGISYSEDLIIWSDKRVDEAGKEEVEKLLESERDFTAIICSNDSVARGAYNALDNNNLKVPEDVSLVGYDDTPIAKILPVSLTTVRQKYRKMGEKAAEFLVERIQEKIDKPQSVKLKSKLIKRESTAKL